jgi:hypothetical protein
MSKTEGVGTTDEVEPMGRSVWYCDQFDGYLLLDLRTIQMTESEELHGGSVVDYDAKRGVCLCESSFRRRDQPVRELDSSGKGSIKEAVRYGAGLGGCRNGL